jgi:hypothetical protein
MTWLRQALVLSAVALFGAGAVADHCTKGTCEKGTCEQQAGSCCKESGECSKESGECCKESGECCKESGECTQTGTLAKAECNGGECSRGAKASLASTGKPHSCPIEAAMAKLPKMTYKVGDETTECAKEAAKLAEQSGAKIEFVVGDKTFEDKQKSFVTLVKTTEEFVDGFAAPHKCSVTGATTVAGTECDCPVEAEKRAKVVRTAMAQVRMTYLVGEKSCDCPIEAKKLAKEDGAATCYLVNGEKTECQYTARLNLARAKYKAAVQAAAKLATSSKAPASNKSDS